MSDSFREVTSTSWFGRIGRSFGGLVVGLVLALAMVVLLFWNEGRAVVTAKSLAEGASAVVSIAAANIDAANDGKLVHVSGPVTAGSTPSDDAFAISQEGLRLVRRVEMYQWKEAASSETKTRVGGGQETVTTYTYSKVWEDSAIDSGSFKRPDGHANPPMEISGQTFQVPEAQLGAFTLDSAVLTRVGGEKPLAISPDRAESIQGPFGGIKKVSIVDGRIYLGFNPTSPTIGDYRIAYDYVPLDIVSIVARQAGSLFAPYQTAAGRELLMVRSGDIPAVDMFAAAVSENTAVTWILRAVGFLVLSIGFALLLAPLGVVADIIPPLGSLVRMGTGLIAFVLAMLVASTTIAVAWFYHRPLLALGILAAGVIAAFAIAFIGRGRRPAAAGQVAMPAPSPAPAPIPAAPAPAAPRSTSSKWN